MKAENKIFFSLKLFGQISCWCKSINYRDERQKIGCERPTSIKKQANRDVNEISKVC